MAYALRYTNVLPADAKPVLHLMNLETNQDIEVPNAHTASFSSDSRWVVYQVDSVPARAVAAAETTPRTPPDSATAGAPGATTPSPGRWPRSGRRDHAAAHGAA